MPRVGFSLGRPQLLRASFWIVIVCLLPFGVSATEPGGEKKIVLIGHELDRAWGTHMYLPTCKLLAKCLEQTPGVHAVISDC